MHQLIDKAQGSLDLQISVVYTSTVAVIHSINELLKISSCCIFFKFPIFSLEMEEQVRQISS